MIKVYCLFTILILLGSCKESESKSFFELSQNKFSNVSSNGDTLDVVISSNTLWSVNSDVKWCTTNIAEGTGNHTLKIYIDSNTELKERTATLRINSIDNSKTITILQKGIVISNDYKYNLPVIFHVLYYDKNNKNQYIEEGVLAEALDFVNSQYGNYKNNSVDMGLEFTLASHDTKGVVLDEPGVERVKWESPKIDILDFMLINNNSYNYLLWDPNKYINVIISPYTDTSLLGISHFPYTPQTNPLEGTSYISLPYLSLSNLKYAYCLSVNSDYAYIKPPALYSLASTLSHELGHYLGMYHVFSEKDESTDICFDSDYCLDTPTYNKDEYTNWVNQYLKSTDKPSFNELVKRYDCNKGQFISRNIMDYDYSYLDEFTPDQHKRVRHILNYVLLIPGPKLNNRTKGDLVEEFIDLPIRVMQ